MRQLLHFQVIYNIADIPSAAQIYVKKENVLVIFI